MIFDKVIMVGQWQGFFFSRGEKEKGHVDWDSMSNKTFIFSSENSYTLR